MILIKRTFINFLAFLVFVNSSFAQTPSSPQLSTLWQKHKVLLEELIYWKMVKSEYSVVTNAHLEVFKKQQELEKKGIDKLTAEDLENIKSLKQKYISMKNDFITKHKSIYLNFAPDVYGKTGEQVYQEDLKSEKLPFHIGDILAGKLLTGENEYRANFIRNRFKFPAINQAVHESRLAIIRLDPRMSKVTEVYEQIKTLESVEKAAEDIKIEVKKKLELNKKQETKANITSVITSIVLFAAIAVGVLFSVKLILATWIISSLVGGMYLAFQSLSNKGLDNMGPNGFGSALLGAPMALVGSVVMAVLLPLMGPSILADKYFGVLKGPEKWNMEVEIQKKQKEIELQKQRYVEFMDKNANLTNQVDELIMKGASASEVVRLVNP